MRRERHQPCPERGARAGRAGADGQGVGAAQHQCVTVDKVPARGESSAQSRAGRQADACVMQRSRCRVDRAEGERAVILTSKADQVAVGTPDRTDDISNGPESPRLRLLQARRLDVDQKQALRWRRRTDGAEDPEQPTTFRACRGCRADK